MTTVDDIDVEAIDVAVVAYRDESVWYLHELQDDDLESVETIAHQLRRYPADTGAIAMISVDEDFLLLIRAAGAHVRVLLSDASAATDWELARSVTDHLGLAIDDDDESEPAGDLAILADLGLPADELGELLDDLADDLELLPDEVLSEVAERLGFGEDFDDLLGIELGSE